jgi:hypothetical protein
MNNKKYEFKYISGSNESNKLIKVLIKLMDEWINLEMYG